MLIIRAITIFLCFLAYLNAFDIDRTLIKNSYISISNEEYKKIQIKDFEKKLVKSFKIKLQLDKKYIKDKTIYMEIASHVKFLKKTNVKYENSFDAIYVKIDKQSLDELYFEFEYDKPQALHFKVQNFSFFEYKYLIPFKHIILGLAYGIIFCAFLYNMVIYFNTLKLSFFYYSLMQLLLLGILIQISRLEMITFISSFDRAFLDSLNNLCIVMALLFSREILNTKNQMAFLDKFLKVLIYLNLLDLIAIFINKSSFLYLYLPKSIIVITLVISGFMAILKGQKTAWFYLLGWIVLFSSVFVLEYKIFNIDGVFILHFGLPLESLILSFALGYKLKKTVDEKNEKEQMLIHQTKLASMGEMINNIAHQWRQPLAHLSFLNMDLQVANESNELDKKYLDDKINESNDQIDFMSQTIDDFKDFYSLNKKKEQFLLSDGINKAINIISPSLKHSKIKLEFEIKEDKQIKSYENEYSQVVLNLLTNAKDILVQRNILNPKIKISLENRANKAVLKVEDNAKGVEKSVINKIFNPYFTTKNKSSGIGLYMSKTIIEKHFNGIISVKNTKEGACFIVEV